MSGPIVRSAPNKSFTANWDSVFGTKKPAAAKAKGKDKPAAKKPVKKKKA